MTDHDPDGVYEPPALGVNFVRPWPIATEADD